MPEDIHKLKELIEASERILITSHISPDGDSVSSTLLLLGLLKLNQPGKTITASMEEPPYDLDFLTGYGEIKFLPLSSALSSFKPDLLIILDANAIHRITRKPDSIDLSQNNCKLAVIDHHVGNEILKPDVYINNSSSAVTLDIYDIFIVRLHYQKPRDYADIALTGIYTDTGGFIYSFDNFRRVYEVVPELLADGANLEKIVSNLNKLSDDDFSMLKELMSNTTYRNDYTYSYISDELAIQDHHQSIVRATELFRVQFLRNIQDRPWGFIVYRDVMEPEKVYTASFRALNGVKDVSVIARRLGGGGHKPAAGAKFEANSIKDAVDKVLAAIEAA